MVVTCWIVGFFLRSVYILENSFRYPALEKSNTHIFFTESEVIFKRLFPISL